MWLHCLKGRAGNQHANGNFLYMSTVGPPPTLGQLAGEINQSLSPGCSRHCTQCTGNHHLLCSGHRSGRDCKICKWIRVVRCCKDRLCCFTSCFTKQPPTSVLSGVFPQLMETVLIEYHGIMTNHVQYLHWWQLQYFFQNMVVSKCFNDSVCLWHHLPRLHGRRTVGAGEQIDGLGTVQWKTTGWGF